MADMILGEHVVSVEAIDGKFRFVVGNTAYYGEPAKIALSAATGDVVRATVEFILVRPE